MTQTITAMYDNHADAVAAQGKLVAIGVPNGSIKLLSGTQTSQVGSGADSAHDEGFWGSLKGIFMPEEDRHTYGEGLSRGGTMLSADVDEVHAEETYDILEQHGSVDLDEREATWRKDGWSGQATGASHNTTAVPAATGGERLATANASNVNLKTNDGSGAVAARSTSQGETEYIPVVEEKLNVGKRMTDSGRVRVRSYAVDKDVSEDVTLRDETVHVDRRPVDRPVTAADEALFADKTIEATERREEAVVSKDARVVEEVGIRKDAGQRTETVSDKVRHTEVEVEDERGNVSRTGAAGTTTGTTGRKPV